jgi:transcriptional regulator with PAS, ATPase and Fis domain
MTFTAIQGVDSMQRLGNSSSQQRIWKSRGLLQGILDAFDGLIYVSSSDYRLEYINPKLIKRRAHDVYTEFCYKALHGREDPCPFCVKDSVNKGEVVSFEIRDPRDQRWYSSINSPVRANSQVVAHLSMITDIHERKVAEISLRTNTEKLREENRLLKSNIKQNQKFGNIIGKSAPMRSVYEQLLNAAASDATVIIYGEPGTGKELAARAIFDMSERRKKRFVPVHCGAIPDTLIESEFFGHKRGAFSGAVAEKPGYIHYAEGGTLFLDEIGEISLSMQTKLLRVIEGGGYTPVGETRIRSSNIRIISATNKNLMDLVGQGIMRQDFFYRIHIFPIQLPPLRDRKEDIPLLVDHFLLLHGGKSQLPPLSSDTMDKLMAYDWPGNVRELQNVIIRYCSTKQINLSHTDASDLSAHKLTSIDCNYEPSQTLQVQLDAFEKKLLSEALAGNKWHRGKTAAQLGVDRKTLFNKIKRHGLG